MRIWGCELVQTRPSSYCLSYHFVSMSLALPIARQRSWPTPLPLQEWCLRLLEVS